MKKLLTITTLTLSTLVAIQANAQAAYDTQTQLPHLSATSPADGPAFAATNRGSNGIIATSNQTNNNRQVSGADLFYSNANQKQPSAAK